MDHYMGQIWTIIKDKYGPYSVGTNCDEIYQLYVRTSDIDVHFTMYSSVCTVKTSAYHTEYLNHIIVTEL